MPVSVEINTSVELLLSPETKENEALEKYTPRSVICGNESLSLFTKPAANPSPSTDNSSNVNADSVPSRPISALAR